MSPLAFSAMRMSSRPPGYDAPSKAHIALASVAKKTRHGGVLINMGLPLGTTVTTPNDQYSDYGPAQLALFVAGAIVLLFFAWSFFQ